MVLSAVAQNGLALKWASKRLRSDPEVIKVATAQSSASVVFAADEWWTRHMASSEETKNISKDSNYSGGSTRSNDRGTSRYRIRLCVRAGFPNQLTTNSPPLLLDFRLAAKTTSTTAAPVAAALLEMAA